MPSNPKAEPYLGQQYRKIKSQCVKKKGLFVDTSFPASGNSIFHTRAAPADIVWKRPKDIVSDPKFFIDKASADDFAQGTLGNCWFVAACACIAEDSNLWKKVVPDYHGQEWSTDNKYAGIFHFRFWRCGKWVDVVIDDQLPTRGGRLIFLHSKSRNEFWSALLEKAYAKLFGSYEALTAGKSRDAMVDLTGGAGETLDIIDFRGEERKTRLFDILHKAKINHSLMCASIQKMETHRSHKDVSWLEMDPRYLTWEKLERMRLKHLNLPNRYSRHFNISIPQRQPVNSSLDPQFFRSIQAVPPGQSVEVTSNSVAPFYTAEKPTCGYFFSRTTENKKQKFGIPPSDLVKWRSMSAFPTQ